MSCFFFLSFWTRFLTFFDPLFKNPLKTKLTRSFPFPPLLLFPPFFFKQKKHPLFTGGLNDKFGFSLAGGGRVSLADPCDLFAARGKAKASTLSLPALVAIEMFNALNALSEDNSLLTVPPTRNPWLLAAMAVSFGLHFLIVYVPPLARIFSIVPLTMREWGLVALFSLPVVLIDELLKLAGRAWWRRENARRMQVQAAPASASSSKAAVGASRRGRKRLLGEEGRRCHDFPQAHEGLQQGLGVKENR